MVTSLKIFLLAVVALYIVVIIVMLKKKMLNLRYTLLWLFCGVIMAIITIFPQIVYNLAWSVGIIDPVNALFFVEGMFVLMLLLYLTSIASRLSNDMRKLAQEQALLERKIEELERNK